MRADYVDRFRRDWTGGLKRMLARGRLVSAGGVSLPDDRHVRRPRHDRHRRVPAHARHLPERVVGSRAAEAGACATRIRAIKDIGYGASAPVGRQRLPAAGADLRRRDAHAARRRASSRCRSRTRSAIMLAGHGGDAVTWLSEAMRRLGHLVGRTASAPVPAVKAFLDANPIAADFGKTWAKRLPASALSGAGRCARAKRRRPDGRATFPTRAQRAPNGVADAIVLRPVAAQPVCRRVSRALRRGARQGAAARDTRDDRRARRQLLDARHGRPRVRAAQPRGRRTSTRTSTRRSARSSTRSTRRSARAGGWPRSAPITA